MTALLAEKKINRDQGQTSKEDVGMSYKRQQWLKITQAIRMKKEVTR